MKTRALIVLGFVLVASLASAAGKPTCVDPALKATIATWPNLSTAYGIYGDGAATDTSGNTVYTDGVQGNYVKFQVCNGSNDFIFNQSRNSSLWWNWGHQVATCTGPGCTTPPAWTSTAQRATTGFLNINKVYTVGVNQEINVYLTGSHPVGNTTYGVRFRNPWSLDYAESPNPSLNIINVPNPTALVRVTHPDCNTWVLTTIPGPSCDPLTCSTPGPSPYSFPVATMLAPLPKNGGMANAGQYELAFSMRLERLTPLTCQ